MDRTGWTRIISSRYSTSDTEGIRKFERKGTRQAHQEGNTTIHESRLRYTLTDKPV